MAEAALKLDTQVNGYNKIQVDGYINMFSEQYEKMRVEYQALLEKNRELTAALTSEKDAAQRQRAMYEDRIKVLESRPTIQPTPPVVVNNDAEAVGKALIDAQLLAKQITDRAKREADAALTAAKAELDKITSAREQIIAELANIQSLLSGLDLTYKTPELQAQKYDFVKPEALV